MSIFGFSLGPKKQFTSEKWISTEVTTSGRKLIVNKDVHTKIFAPVGKHQLNLISVFGRARQGKSFLMNCLAGEKEIFRVSNEKDACTQGIDISDKFLSLSDFSGIDGGSKISGGKIHVGFVDAEGQGDKNVTYDATLVCPILIASKCVIFNWKGDLQKDLILETLGIMTKAAQNVATDAKTSLSSLPGKTFPSASSSSSRGTARTTSSKIPGETKKIFSHLHIVFRDWQAATSDPTSVHSVLFGAEGTAEAETRDRIRREVLSCFASVRVWLFDAPSENVRALKSKLTYDATIPIFKRQLRDLREALSVQLKEPVLLGGVPLTGSRVAPLIAQVAEALNKGEAIMPHSSFVNMMRAEVEKLRGKLEADTRVALDNLLASINHKSQPNGAFMLNEADALRQIDEVMKAQAVQYHIGTGLVVGEDISPDLATQVNMDNSAALNLMQENLRKQYLAEYKVIFTQWLRKKSLAAEEMITAALSKLEPHFQAGRVSEQKVEDELEHLRFCFKESMGEQFYESGPQKLELQRAVTQVERHFELRCAPLREIIKKNSAKTRATIDACIKAAVAGVQSSIDTTVTALCERHKTGYTRSVLNGEMDLLFESVSIPQLTASINAEGISLDPITMEDIERRFEEECKALAPLIKTAYNRAQAVARQAALQQAEAFITREAQALISRSFEMLSDQAIESECTRISDAAEAHLHECVSGWTLSALERQGLLSAFTPVKVKIVAAVKDHVAGARKELAQAELARQRAEAAVAAERERVRLLHEQQEREKKRKRDQVEAEELAAEMERQRLLQQESDRLLEQREAEQRKKPAVAPDIDDVEEQLLRNLANQKKKRSGAKKKDMITSNLSVEEQIEEARKFAFENRLKNVYVPDDPDDISPDGEGFTGRAPIEVENVPSNGPAPAIVVSGYPRRSLSKNTSSPVPKATVSSSSSKDSGRREPAEATAGQKAGVDVVAEAKVAAAAAMAQRTAAAIAKLTKK